MLIVNNASFRNFGAGKDWRQEIWLRFLIMNTELDELQMRLNVFPGVCFCSSYTSQMQISFTAN